MRRAKATKKAAVAAWLLTCILIRIFQGFFSGEATLGSRSGKDDENKCPGTKSEREERRELSCNSLARTSFSVSSVATAFAGLQIIECVAMPLMLLFL